MEQRPARIDGEDVYTDRVSEVFAPFDGRPVGAIARCDSAHVDRAVSAAQRAFRQEPMPAWRRAEVLDRAAKRLQDPGVREDLARTIALEAAKPIRTARIEVDRCVSTFQFSAAVCRSLSGEMLPLDSSEVGEGKLGFALRVPVGVIGAITPFNFPLNLVAHKVAPAIAAGCPVVLKPAGQTPFSGLRLAELLLDDCGLDAGYLHVVPGSGREVGVPLVDHPDVAMITFTGSPEVGWGIRASAPRKRVSLELGNNAPVIIEPDADLEAAARKIALAANSHAGQSCISVQRVLVSRSVHDSFVDLLVHEVEKLVVGDPLDERTDVSALIDRANRDRVDLWVHDAVAAGARLRTGGERIGEASLRPVVLTEVQPEMEVCRTEVFGPLVGVQAYDGLDEALALANDTRYGLQAGIFTGSLPVARRALLELDFGGVIINDVPTWRADQMPYGGLRDSGNTREGPAYAVKEMTELRTVVFT